MYRYKNKKIILFIYTLTVILCVFVNTKLCFAADDQADENYYDYSSIECGPTGSSLNDGELRPTSEINIMLDPVTGETKVKEQISLINISQSKFVNINCVSLKPYISDVDVGSWKLINTFDKSVVFQGNCGDRIDVNIDLAPNTDVNNYSSTVILEAVTTLSGDKAAKIANTRPSFFEYSYDAYEKKPKAVYSNGILKFYYDYKNHQDEGDVYDIDDFGNRSWESVSNLTSTIEFDETFYEFKPKTCKEWFKDFTICSDVKNIRYLNTMDVEDMQWMFADCHLLKNIDPKTLLPVGNKVKNLTFMFKTCGNIKALDVSSWDVSNVEYLAGTFAECSLVNYFDVSNWNTVSCLSFDSLFCGCDQLTYIPCENFNTSNAVRLNYIFYRCINLLKVDLSKWDTSKCEKLYDLFAFCYKLENVIGLDRWNTSRVDDMGGIFYECLALTQINIKSWDTKNIKWFTVELGEGLFRGMFMHCSNLTTIIASENFVTYNAIYSTYMFYGSTNIVGGNGTRYDPNVIDKTYARIDNSWQKGYFTKYSENNLDLKANKDFDASIDKDSVEDKSYKSKDIDSSTKLVGNTANTDCNLVGIEKQKENIDNNANIQQDKASKSPKTGDKILILALICLIIILPISTIFYKRIIPNN